METIISHFEGCSGNFIGYLYAGAGLTNKNIFRVDTKPDDVILSIDGRNTWSDELKQIVNHRVIVTHQFDRQLIQKTFPTLQHIAIWPYTKVMNVLWNVCFKKLPDKNMSQIDYHYINLKVWHNKLKSMEPNYQCYDYGQLTNQDYVEQMLNIRLTAEQKDFFDHYWKCQLNKTLNWPHRSMSIPELIEWYGVENDQSDWYTALILYSFEKLNGLEESQRQWSIDDVSSTGWDKIIPLQQKYYFF